jgi:hypothetical protein
VILFFTCFSNSSRFLFFFFIIKPRTFYCTSLLLELCHHELQSHTSLIVPRTFRYTYPIELRTSIVSFFVSSSVTTNFLLHFSNWTRSATLISLDHKASLVLFFFLELWHHEHSIASLSLGLSDYRLYITLIPLDHRCFYTSLFFSNSAPKNFLPHLSH